MDKPRLSIDLIKDWAKALLTKELINSDLNSDQKLTLGITKKDDMMRIDLSINKNKGVVRVPNSINPSTGLITLPLDLKQLKDFKPKDAKMENLIKDSKSNLISTLLTYAKLKLAAGKKDFFSRLKKGYEGKIEIQHHLSIGTGGKEIKFKGKTYAREHFDFRLEVPGGDLSLFYFKNSMPEDADIKEKRQKVMDMPDNKLHPEHSYVSFAIPKAKLPENPGDKISMIRVEDHPFEYSKSELLNDYWEIPENYYGGGIQANISRGTFKVLSVDNKRVVIFLNTEDQYKGAYSIVYMSGNNFLLIALKEQEVKELEDKYNVKIALLKKVKESMELNSSDEVSFIREAEQEDIGERELQLLKKVKASVGELLMYWAQSKAIDIYKELDGQNELGISPVAFSKEFVVRRGVKRIILEYATDLAFKVIRDASKMFHQKITTDSVKKIMRDIKQAKNPK